MAHSHSGMYGGYGGGRGGGYGDRYGDRYDDRGGKYFQTMTKSISCGWPKRHLSLLRRSAFIELILSWIFGCVGGYRGGGGGGGYGGKNCFRFLLFFFFFQKILKNLWPFTIF